MSWYRFICLLSFAFAGCALLLTLCIFQLFRGIDKRERASLISNQLNTEDNITLVSLPQTLEEAYYNRNLRTSWQFKIVQLQGEFDHANEQFIFSTLPDGAPGFKVMTPFIIGGKRITVFTGMVSVNTDTGRMLPDTDFHRRSGKVMLYGYFDWPKTQTILVPKPDIRNNIWFSNNIKPITQAAKSLPVIFITTSRSYADHQSSPVIYSDSPPSEAYFHHFSYSATWGILFVFWVIINYSLIRRSFHITHIHNKQ